MPLERLPEILRARVEAADVIEAMFDGNWPPFHDAEVLQVMMDRKGPTVRFLLLVPWQRSNIPITLECLKVSEIELENLNHQNLLAEIVFKAGPEANLAVDLIGIYGLNGTLRCGSIRAYKTGNPGVTAGVA